jgi:hypothetical protein
MLGMLRVLLIKLKFPNQAGVDRRSVEERYRQQPQGVLSVCGSKESLVRMSALLGSKAMIVISSTLSSSLALQRYPRWQQIPGKTAPLFAPTILINLGLGVLCTGCSRKAAPFSRSAEVWLGYKKPATWNHRSEINPKEVVYGSPLHCEKLPVVG